MTEPTASASPATSATTGASATSPSQGPAIAHDTLVPAAEKGAGAPAKCLGLFVILAIVYFWNLYCLNTVVPKVSRLLDEAGIELNDHQQKFNSMSTAIAQQPKLSIIPIAVIVAMGLAALATRYWSLFGGAFFAMIVALFLLFLYGWLVFAVPLIQIQQRPSGGPSFAPSGSGS